MGQSRPRIPLVEEKMISAQIIRRESCLNTGVRCPGLALLNLRLLQREATFRQTVLHLVHKSAHILVFAEMADKAIAEECLSIGALSVGRFVG
jgi:hypothetical protein